MSLSGAQVTRLWPYGGPGTNYGSFAGKAGTPPTITTTTLPDGTVGVAYSETIAVTGSAPITFAVTVGALPDGLTLDANTGEISGTPTTVESASFTIEATNAAGTDDQAYTLDIVAAPVVANIPMGGAGYPPSVYWQGRRRKRTLADQPEKQLKKIIDTAVAEYYADIVESSLPQTVKEQAAAIVKPYAQKAAKRVAVPAESQVNWKKLARDTEQVRELLNLWKREILAREIDMEDEYLLLVD